MGRQRSTRTPAARQLRRLLGVVGEQLDPVDPEREQHLRGHGVGALVHAEAERLVGLERVQSVVLQGVGVDLVVEPDPPSLLPQVHEVAAGLVDPSDGLGQLRAAVAAPAAEDVAGEALAVEPHERRRPVGIEHPVAEGEHQVLPPVVEAVEREDLRVDRRSPAEAERQRHRRRTRRAGRHGTGGGRRAST